MADLAVILLVDDDDNDLFLLRRSFAKANVLNPIQLARSGEDAIAYLSGEGKCCDRSQYPVPGLVLIDLKMRGKDGFEVLGWIRKQSGFLALPVVVLSGNEDAHLRTRAYQLGASAFLVKPNDLQHSVEMSQALADKWLAAKDTPALKTGQSHGETQQFIREVLGKRAGGQSAD
jgi:CheY-like chemotaxis protein